MKNRLWIVVSLVLLCAAVGTADKHEWDQVIVNRYAVPTSDGGEVHVIVENAWVWARVPQSGQTRSVGLVRTYGVYFAPQNGANESGVVFSFLRPRLSSIGPSEDSPKILAAALTWNVDGCPSTCVVTSKTGIVFGNVYTPKVGGSGHDFDVLIQSSNGEVIADGGEPKVVSASSEQDGWLVVLQYEKGTFRYRLEAGSEKWVKLD